MIELRDKALVFSFPEVHEDATMAIDFQRTLRIPDDGRKYLLPPGIGRFPVRHVDDFAERVPGSWLEHGGVVLPMYQSEAMWLNFSSRGGRYPFAVRVATGKIDALTGKTWTDRMRRKRQNYLVIPEQPWLDGYCVKKGVIRQFVAMPLGSGYSAEEQITGEAEYGGLQVIAYPMKAKRYERLVKERGKRVVFEDVLHCVAEDAVLYGDSADLMRVGAPLDMGLAPGGRMRQKIYEDPFKLEDWDLENASRCFVHIANSLVWRAISGENPPTVPPTSKEYTDAGLPWFELYDEHSKALQGSLDLAGLKSVKEMGAAKGDVPLPENESVTPDTVVPLRKRRSKDQVREGVF